MKKDCMKRKKKGERERMADALKKSSFIILVLGISINLKVILYPTGRVFCMNLQFCMSISF